MEDVLPITTSVAYFEVKPLSIVSDPIIRFEDKLIFVTV